MVVGATMRLKLHIRQAILIITLSERQYVDVPLKRAWETTYMLDVFITSRVRRKIIVIYAKYPDFKTHVRGLAKLIKEDAGNIQRELKRLEKVGFLVSEKQGNTKIYHTNKQFV